jgi:hypothetical protein
MIMKLQLCSGALLGFAWVGWLPAAFSAETNVPPPAPAYLTGALAKDEPQPIYSDDPQDSWNRIFHALFTRTLQLQLSQDYTEGAPFAPPKRTIMGRTEISQRVFERIESGDRAVEPLFPHEQFRSDVSAAQVLAEPRFSQLRQALTEALAEPAARPALHRALMQSDLWAAFDTLSSDVTAWILKDAPIPLYLERQRQLRPQLARLVKKLALTPEEIKALPANYAAAREHLELPDLFSPDSDWIEIVWNPQREHDRAAHFRRATRVFFKPAQKPKDKLEFLRSLADEEVPAAKLEAAALVIQNLLVDTRGGVVPSPLVAAVQIRGFGAGARAGATRFFDHELSRRALLKEPAEGGLKSHGADPFYLPGAGNDYSYAPPAVEHAVAIRMATQCTSCHGPRGIFSLNGPRQIPGQPKQEIRSLNPADNDQPLFVAKTKAKDETFKLLMEAWK